MLWWKSLQQLFGMFKIHLFYNCSWFFSIFVTKLKAASGYSSMVFIRRLATLKILIPKTDLLNFCRKSRIKGLSLAYAIYVLYTLSPLRQNDIRCCYVIVNHKSLLVYDISCIASTRITRQASQFPVFTSSVQYGLYRLGEPVKPTEPNCSCTVNWEVDYNDL